MNKLLIWTVGNKVNEDYTPSERFKTKLDKVVELYRENKNQYDEIEILVSGRWANSTDNHLKTESRVAKEYILKRIPEAFVIEENISVDSIGNFAFSKPLILSRNPSKVIGVMQELLKDRTLYLVDKILGNAIPNLELVYVHDVLQNDPS